MNKKIFLLPVVASFLLLTAFGKPQPILVKDVEINVIKTASILRYDMVLKKNGELKNFKREIADSPGHEMFNRGGSINFAIRPNEALASLMVLEGNTKYVKMQLAGGGTSGDLQRTDQITVNLEYAIKNNVDVEEVRIAALDSTLIVLIGNKVIIEIPLRKAE